MKRCSDLISRSKIHKRLNLGFMGWASSSGLLRVWECPVLWGFGSGFAPVHLDRCIKSSAELNQEQAWGTRIFSTQGLALLVF